MGDFVFVVDWKVEEIVWFELIKVRLMFGLVMEESGVVDGMDG